MPAHIRDGTVDAGDAGIRASGDLVIAAAHVANADNIQEQGKSSGIPLVAQRFSAELNPGRSGRSMPRPRYAR